MKAVIIGAGSTIYDKNHLVTLAKSNFDGYVLPTDRILKYALEHGITPSRFPRYYTAIINDLMSNDKWYLMESMFNHQIVKKHAKDIKCFLSSQVHPKQRSYLSKMGISIVGYYHMYGKSPLYPTPPKPEPMELEDCGNVSIALWSLAKESFHCSEIALLGIDLSYSKYDAEFYHGNTSTTWDYELSCSLKLLETSTGVKTYNCTEGGRLYGPGIINSTLKDFLNP